MKLCVVLGYDVRIKFGYRDITDMTCEKIDAIFESFIITIEKSLYYYHVNMHRV